MPTGSLIFSSRDLDFLIFEWLDVGSLTARPRFREHSVDAFAAILDLGEEIATKHFAPHNKLLDSLEPTIGEGGIVELPSVVVAALDSFQAAGLLSASFPERLGGSDLPTTVRTAVQMWFSAANTSMTGYPFLAAAAARLLVAHANAEVVEAFARPIIEGRFYGTMCLSEVQAGSSLADIVTKAVPHADGSYRITGSKMWISAGDHNLGENIVHLVLARTGDRVDSGLSGLSLFVVPKFLARADGSIGDRNDVELVGLNHKMGNRGTTNTVLSFGTGAAPGNGGRGAVGYLVGIEGQGLAQMFHMMNEARIGVGAGAVALGYTGYLKSLDYARGRTQGRLIGDSRSARGEPVAIISHPDVRRMLLQQKAFVEGGLALVLYCSFLVDEAETAETPEARRSASLLLDLLTPVSKSFPSQWCLAANDLAIQVHGGYGYTRDYDLEQHYRDNRLNQIHEGTHGIQAIDLLGRKVRTHDGAGFALLIDVIRTTVARARDFGGQARQMATDLVGRVDRLVEVTARLRDESDRAASLCNASIYLEAFGHTVVAWLWLEQVLTAHDKVGDFYAGKRVAATYFFSFELPKVDVQFDLLDSANRLTLDLDDSCL